MGVYKYLNLNPKGRKIGDCAVRAVTLAVGLDYRKVYFDLCKLGDKRSSMPNEIDVLTEYMESFGFKKDSLKVVKGGHRYTVRSFAETHPTGVYFLRVVHHFTTVVNGDWYDIWDCGDCSVYWWMSKEKG